jgi:hypothetical protein
MNLITSAAALLEDVFMYVIRLSNGTYLQRNWRYTNDLENAKIYVKQYNANAEVRFLNSSSAYRHGLTAEVLKVRLVADQ